MRGKAGLVIGLAVGYVLGTRAGRERYEQIKSQWLKVWDTEAVQTQVTKVKDFAKSQAMALPSTLWDSAVKVAQAAGSKGSAGQKLDAALKVGKDSGRRRRQGRADLDAGGEGRRRRRHRRSARERPRRGLT